MDELQKALRAEILARLAAAPDSPAKTEMVEELSDNLYQRCLECLHGGGSEAEALETALAELGDVQELLAWLRDSSQAPAPAAGGPDVPLHSLVVQTRALDVLVCCRPIQQPMVEYNGGTVFTQEENGVLYVREQPQKNGRLFGLWALHTGGEVRITLPAHSQWERVSLATASGDVVVESGLQAQKLALRSQSGDITCQDFAGALAAATNSGDVQVRSVLPMESVQLKSTSGDIECHADSDRIQASSTSGDVELEGRLGDVNAKSISGDVTVRGSLRRLTASATSGDVELHLHEAPQEVSVATISGDIELDVPSNSTFKAQLHTVSGEVEMPGVNITLL